MRLLELGAGTGKFACLFLRHLEELSRSKDVPSLAVRYCMTDCSETVLESWRANPYLAEFTRRGLLEFALLRAGEKTSPQFTGAKSPAGSGFDFLQAGGPLVLIANYVFDSLPQDAFVIEDGQIFESLVSVTTEASGSGSASAITDLSRLQLSYKNKDIAADHYSCPAWNHILEGYRRRLPSFTVLFPTAALTTLDEIRNLTDGRLLILAADKGYAHESDLKFCQGPPALEWHNANCFSQMVTFDAIAKYFKSIGGEALLPDKHCTNLNICAFFERRAGDQFPATQAAYYEAQKAFGPDDLFTLLAWLNAHMEEMTVAQILAALRLTHWDPVAFMRLFPVLGRQLRTVAHEREDLRHAVGRVWANHYPVSHEENILAFHCGVVLLELRFFADAMRMFKTSQEIFGPSATTSYNLGLCAQGLERFDEALAFMTEACALDPALEPARTARLKLESKKQASSGD